MSARGTPSAPADMSMADAGALLVDAPATVEAPDIDTAHRVSLISRAEGAVMAESWPAMPYDEFLKLCAQRTPLTAASSGRGWSSRLSAWRPNARGSAIFPRR